MDYLDPINCKRCGTLLMFASGDLNCCNFVCVNCISSEERTYAEASYEEQDRIVQQNLSNATKT